MKIIRKKISAVRLDKSDHTDLSNVSGFSVQNTGDTRLFISNISSSEKVIDIPPGGIREFGETVGLTYSGKLYLIFDSQPGQNGALVIKNVIDQKDC